jgi:hypothetical protein
MQRASKVMVSLDQVRMEASNMYGRCIYGGAGGEEEERQAGE